METTTYIKQVRQADASHQQQVMQLLNMDELAYCYNKFNKGLEYAFKQVDGDTFGFDTLIKSKTFWSYFKNEWSKREAIFLNNFYFNNYDDGFIKEEYEFIHSYNGIRASKPIDQIENEFSYLWGKVWKEMRHV